MIEENAPILKGHLTSFCGSPKNQIYGFHNGFIGWER